MYLDQLSMNLKELSIHLKELSMNLKIWILIFLVMLLKIWKNINNKLKEENNKLKEENNKLKEENNKLKEKGIDKGLQTEENNKLKEKGIDKGLQTEENNKLKEKGIDKGFKFRDDCNVWYMNGNLEDIDKWDIFVNNNFVKTWNKEGRNEKIKTKIKKGDIIAWYIVSRGYNSILKVIDNPKVMTDTEFKLLYNDTERKERKDDIEKGKYEFIIIPVNFLATTKTNFIKKSNISNYNKKWTPHCRSSNAVKPNNPDWIEQVIKMYNYLKK